MTRSNNEKGNQYHDEEGKFTSKDDTGEVKKENSKEDYLLSPEKTKTLANEILSQVNIPSSVVEETNSDSTKERKKISEMNDVELRQEIYEHQKYFQKNRIGLGGAEEFGGHLQLRCANYRKLIELLQKFPVDLSMTKILFTNLSVGLGAATCDYNEILNKSIPCKTLKFDKESMVNLENYIKNIKEGIESGISPIVDEENLYSYVLTHEYGHFLHNTIVAKEINQMVFAMTYEDFVRCRGSKLLQIRRKVNAIYDEMYDDNQFNSDQCLFARTNNFEWFAETFASLNCGKPTKTALALGEYLKSNGYGG